MGYSNANLFLVDEGIEGAIRKWAYFTADSLATVLGAAYFSDGYKFGMRLGDIVEVFVGTANAAAVSTGPTTQAVGAASLFSALTAHARCQATTVNASTNAVTLTALPSVIGPTTSSPIGFFGAAVTVQPTSSNEAAVGTTNAVSISATQWGFSTSIQANAIVTLVNQIRADLVSLGLVKGS